MQRILYLNKFKHNIECKKTDKIKTKNYDKK